MRRLRPAGATRTWTRLFAIALLPLIGLITVTSLASVSSWRSANTSQQINANVQRTSTVTTIDLLVSRETYLTAALAYGQHLHLDAGGVGKILHLDLPASMRDVRSQLNQQFDRLAPNDPLLPYRAQMAGLRTEIDGGHGSMSDAAFRMGHVSSAVNAVADRAFDDASQRATDLNASGDIQRALTVLAATREVANATYNQLGDVSTIVFRQPEAAQSMSDLRISSAQLDLARRDLDHLTGGSVGRAWKQLSADSVLQGSISRFSALAASDLPTVQRMPLTEVVGAFSSGMTRLEKYDDLEQLAAADAVRQADQERADALGSIRRSIGAMAGLVVVTLLLTAAVVRSVARPLRRLRDDAGRVSAGDLDEASLVPAGPRELRAVTATFGEVVANLRTVEAQVAALAAGEMDDPILDEPVPGRLGTLLHDSVERLSRSMTDQEKLTAQLAHEARHDPLTGLPNRTAAAEELSRALARAQRAGTPLAVLYIDLDGFKHVNDNLGHSAGDALLQGTAGRLRDCLRAGDFAARIGGDEFLVITEQAAAGDEVVVLGERIVAEISEPLAIGVGVTRVGASVGVALALDGETDADRLLRDADAAAYHAKASGRGRVEVFGEALRAELKEHSETEQALREALTRDELHLQFQPVVDPQGWVGGVEALLRWNRPGVGPVPPNDFIPVAESSDLIIDIGRWVLDHACEHLALWHDDPVLRDLTMAVNLSGRHLLSLTVVKDVRDALARYGVEPGRLAVEVTETTMLTDIRLVTEHLNELRELGVHVAIDDFGTGYTSLVHLRSLPADILKIDRSMVSSGDKGVDAHVLALLVETAHALGLRLVAEGVETPEQLERVRLLGCQSIQGFLFSRPLPVVELRSYIERTQADQTPPAWARERQAS